MFPGLPPPFCIMQAIKNWTVGRPGNEAILDHVTIYMHAAGEWLCMWISVNRKVPTHVGMPTLAKARLTIRVCSLYSYGSVCKPYTFVAVTGRKRTLFRLGQKWVNSANQVLGASPASCASTSAIRCLYEQLCLWKSFDLRALRRIRTRYSRRAVKVGKIQRLVSLVLHRLQTRVKHQQWDGSLI